MIAFPDKKSRKKSKTRRPRIILDSDLPKPEPVEEKGVDVRLPKIDGLQDSMVALGMAIQDNIVGITDDLFAEHVKFIADDRTGFMITLYKGKPVLLSGFRSNLIIGGRRPEFFIESMGAVSA